MNEIQSSIVKNQKQYGTLARQPLKSFFPINQPVEFFIELSYNSITSKTGVYRKTAKKFKQINKTLSK